MRSNTSGPTATTSIPKLEAAACRYGAGIRSEKRARRGRVRNVGWAHTAYEEDEFPGLLDDDALEVGVPDEDRCVNPGNVFPR